VAEQKEMSVKRFVYEGSVGLMQLAVLQNVFQLAVLLQDLMVM
jgi:hypothetical protein